MTWEQFLDHVQHNYSNWPTPAIVAFEVAIIVAAGVTYRFFNARMLRVRQHFILVASSVFAMEFFTAPMWFNLNLGVWGYVYSDVSWVLTLAWTTMILIDRFGAALMNPRGMPEANRGLVEHTALEEAAVKATATAATKKAEAILLGEKAAASLAKHSKEIQEFIKNLGEQAFAHGKSAVMVNLHKAALLGITDPKILNDIKNLSVALQDFSGKAVTPKLELPAEMKPPEIAVDPAVLERMQKLVDAFGLMRIGAINLKPPITELQESMRKFGQETGQAFSTALLHGRGFGDVLKSLLVDLVKLTAQMAFGASIKGMGTTGASGFFRSLLGGLVGFAPGFAGGGDFMAGQAIRVGEQGPELAVFNRPGTIIPNGSSAARGGIVQNVHIDARGADIGVYHKLNMLFMKQAFRDYTLALADHARRTI